MTVKTDDYRSIQLREFSCEVARGRYKPTQMPSEAASTFFISTLASVLGNEWRSADTMSFLDCGMGTGSCLELIARERTWGHSVLSGFDLTPAMVEQCEARFTGRIAPHFSMGYLHSGDLTSAQAYNPPPDSPGRGGPYDVVFCFGVIQQLPHTLRMSAVQRMIEAVKLGGCVLIFDRHKYSMFGIKMNIKKQITRWTRWNLVPRFFLVANYPDMKALSRCAERLLNARARLHADAKHTFYALELRREK
jgi:SAM-dependent methyltransferase